MWKYNQTPTGDELMHYGILGMKWGVRRSKAQLARVRKKSKSNPDENASDDYKKARSKSTKEMSDAELQTAIRRLQMEQQYKNLNPPTVSKGKKVVDTVLKAAGSVALDAGKQLAKDALVKKGKSVLGLDDGKSDYEKEFETITKINKMEAAKKLYKTNTGQDWSYMK